MSAGTDAIRPRSRAAVAAVAILAAVAACDGTAGSAPRPPVPSAAYHLNPDGAVPWVDEPIDSVHSPPPPPTVRAGSGPCRSDQLTARLDKWWKPVPGAGGGHRVGADPGGALGGHLIGEVHARNVSGRDCTLQGQVDARLYSAGAEVPVHYSNGVNDAARDRVVPVPAGGTATLRIDWTGPYCGSAGPPYDLVIRLPHDGGELRAPVGPRDKPACSQSESRPETSSYLSAGAFEPPASVDPQASVRSPLSDLRATVSGPRQANPGQRLTYEVTLTNPTGTAVTLQPCPGYLQELHSQGVQEVGLSTSTLYRLNCRPVDAVPARGKLRFQMVVVVPAQLRAGRRLTITWRATTAQNLASSALAGVLTVDIV